MSNSFGFVGQIEAYELDLLSQIRMIIPNPIML